MRARARPVAPAERTAPAVNRSVPAVQRTAPAAASEQPKRLDSSRFAHPQGNTVRETQPARTAAPNREIQRSVPAGSQPRAEDRGNSNGNPRATGNYGSREVMPAQPRQEYRAPAQQPRQVHQAPQRSVQENRAPAQQPRQEYQAPQRNVQENRAPQNNVQQYQRAPQPQVQRNAQTTRPAPQEHKKDDKNDKNDNNGHH